MGQRRLDKIRVWTAPFHGIGDTWCAIASIVVVCRHVETILAARFHLIARNGIRSHRNEPDIFVPFRLSRISYDFQRLAATSRRRKFGVQTSPVPNIDNGAVIDAIVFRHGKTLFHKTLRHLLDKRDVMPLHVVFPQSRPFQKAAVSRFLERLDPMIAPHEEATGYILLAREPVHDEIR